MTNLSTQFADPRTEDIAMRPFSASLPMALLQAREATMRRFRPLLAEYDLTEQQWRILRALAAATEPLATGEVAEQTFLLGPSVSRMVVGLEERGLIDRTPAPEDNRRSNLRLAAAGHRLVQTVAPFSEATYNDIETAFGAERLTSLMSELHDFFSVLEPPQNLVPQ